MQRQGREIGQQPFQLLTEAMQRFSSGLPLALDIIQHVHQLAKHRGYTHLPPSPAGTRIHQWLLYFWFMTPSCK